jgi:membrane protease YdiL (CAAX protease family)
MMDKTATTPISAPPRRIGAGLVDIALCLLAYLAAAAVQSVAMTAVTGSVGTASLSDPRIVATLFVVPLIVLPILTLLLWARGESWSTFGLRRPDDLGQFTRLAVGVSVLTIVFGYAWGAFVRSTLPDQTPSILAELRGHLPALLVFLAYTFLPVGLVEELSVRGLLMNRIAQMLGGGTSAWVVSVVGASLLFGLLHASRGLGGVVFAAGMGVLFGLIYLRTGRNLWIVVIAHSAYDSAKVIQQMF